MCACVRFYPSLAVSDESVFAHRKQTHTSIQTVRMDASGNTPLRISQPSNSGVKANSTPRASTRRSPVFSIGSAPHSIPVVHVSSMRTLSRPSKLVDLWAAPISGTQLERYSGESLKEIRRKQCFDSRSMSQRSTEQPCLPGPFSNFA